MKNVFSAVLLVVGFVNIAVVPFASARMSCLLKSEGGIEGAIHELMDSCPPPLFNQDKEYCCYNLKGASYCCDLPDFALNMALWLIPALILLLIISSIVSCICCLCCPCCFFYKRRHGRVYRRDQSPISQSLQPSTSSSAYYQPIHPQPVTQLPRTHLPPGAYPVFPQSTGMDSNFTRQEIRNKSSVYSHQPNNIT